MNRHIEVRRKIWSALKPAGKDLECIIGIDDPMESGCEAVHVYMTNHSTGTTIGLITSLEEQDSFIVRAVVGAAKAAWPGLTGPIRWEDV